MTNKMGTCEDTLCEYADEPEPVLLTHLEYFDSNKGPGWVCESCLEGWSDALEDYTNNRADMDVDTGYPMIPGGV